MAFVWFILGVNDLMPTQGGGQAKPFATRIANKRTRESVIRHFEVNC